MAKINCMYFTASLVPKDIIIEADSEEDFQEKLKRITIKDLVFTWGKMSKEDFKREMRSRYIYVK